MVQTITPRTRFIVLGATMLGMLLSALDQTVVGTAMPRIIADLNGTNLYSWVFTAYMLTSTTAVPIVGKLSDMYGRKLFLLIGIAIFLAGSALSGTSTTMVQLIAFRAVQGVGGGFIFSGAFAIIGDLFAPAERGKYAGLMSGVFGLASIIGPLVGGFITDNLNWRWVFYVNLPLGLFALLLLFLILPPMHSGRTNQRVDFLGAVVLIASISPMLLGFSWAGVDYPWGSPQVIGSLSLAAVMLCVFVLVELRVAEPIIPLSLFRTPVFAVVFVVTALTGAGMFINSVLIPLFMQGVLGASATNSGLVLMPMTFGIVAGSTLGGQLVSRTGRYRFIIAGGIAIAVAGVYLLSTMTPSTSRMQASSYMFVVGFGLGFTMPTLVIAVQNAFSFEVLGTVTSMITFARSVGGTIGIAVFTSLMTSRLSGEVDARMPADVPAAAPAKLMDALRNPRILLNEGALSQIRSFFDGIGRPELFDEAIGALKAGLAVAITDVFFLAMFVVIAAFLIALILPEHPLRTTSEAPWAERQRAIAAAAAREAGAGLSPAAESSREQPLPVEAADPES